MESSSRYLIGIDLGTTNSVVAYVDTEETSEKSPDIHLLPIPQLVAPGEVRDFTTLPSFIYFPTEHDLAAGPLTLPWQEEPAAVIGVMAREQGALAPGRQVSSAKSWLCNPGVNRRAKLLPPQAQPPEPTVSPVEASAAYLIHLQNAWDHAMVTQGHGGGASRFERQEIVLTVPASFDAEARDLTVEAARLAGLTNLTLLEEPMSAFYAWIAAHRARLQQQVRDGDLVLICDIGGGTSDFSLIRVRAVNEDVQFERIAIGEHLLLGGDNLDLALANRVESKLQANLGSRQRQSLRRACAAAKEQLLGDATLASVPIRILGEGRAVVGGMLSSELTRDEVVESLSGFLPLTDPADLPTEQRRVGLRELGLPYATDPAITKHLAAFLTAAAESVGVTAGGSAINQRASLVRPDAILFNGGFLTPTLARERIAAVVGRWFHDDHRGWRPRILDSTGMDTAVAVGAAYYGQVRRGAGLRIQAGSARTYYIGLRHEPHQVEAVCVLPFGVQEGTTLALADREFAVLANRPVSFSLYSSTVRHDLHGAVATLGEDAHRHAPLVTLLRYGKKLREQHLDVRLTATYTELGTLELWCESVATAHRWRLQFELRGDSTDTNAATAQSASTEAHTQASADESVEAAVRLVHVAFGAKAGEDVTPDALVVRLETALGVGREAWPVAIARRLADELLELTDARKQSPKHEVRWLNLVGYCLRPGFGAPRDDSRMARARQLYQAGLAFPDDLQCQVEWLVLWRRVAGGINASQQHELHRTLVASLGKGRTKGKARLNRQVEREIWRLLASLEHLTAALRTSLGDRLLTKIAEEPAESIWLWSLGRFGARIPVYGPSSCVVPVETVTAWLDALLQVREFTDATAFAVAQLAIRTGDQARDVDDGLRRRAISRLQAAGVEEPRIKRLREYAPPGRTELGRILGEPLPPGLNFVSSVNCLLPLSGLVSGPEKGDTARHAPRGE